MTTNIVILGGGGFIGTNLHKHFLKNNIESRSISRNFQRILDNQVKTDAFDIKTYKKHINQETILIDLLNTPDIQSQNKHKELINKIKILSPKKIIFFSSAAVYGNTPAPATENTPAKPINTYGQNKLELERLIISTKIPFLIFRTSSVFGRYQSSKNNQIISNYFESVLKNVSPVINNDGSQIRDFINIKDVVNITRLTMPHQIGIFNLSSNVGTIINELWNKISIITQTDIQPLYFQNSNPEIHISILNNKKMNSILDYQYTNLDQGLTETWNWFKNNIKV